MSKYSMDIINQRFPTFRQLQCFLAVAQEKNFSLAANILHMTQPPLSRNIQSLEEVLGNKLFIRNKNGIELSQFGEDFEKITHELLNKFNKDISKIIKKNIGKPINISLTSNLNFENEFWLKKISENEGVKLNKSNTSKNIIKDILENRVDIGIVGEQTTEDNSLHFHFLYQEKMCLVLPTKYIDESPDTNLLNIKGLPLFWFKRCQNKPYYDKCNKFFRRKNLKFDIKIEYTDTLKTLIEISNGNGFSIFPKSKSYFPMDGVTYLDIDSNICKEIGVNIFLVRKSVIECNDLKFFLDDFQKELIVH